MTRIKRDITAIEKAMGEQLRALRREKMTQTELAEQLQARLGEAIAQSSVSDWETGRLRLHGELITELCRILETDANTLLGIHHPKVSKRLIAVTDSLQQRPKRQQERLIKQFLALIADESD